MLRQSGLILLLGFALGIGVNQARRDRIEWVGEWSPRPSSLSRLGQARPISIEEAERLFLKRGALFIDARPPQLYRQGHITGALNLPPESREGFRKGVMAHIPVGAPIVIYCEGERSFQSRALSRELISKGYGNVQILGNGWNQWVARELPLEAGPWFGEQG